MTTTQPETQEQKDIAFLLTSDAYLRLLKSLETRRESAISTFSAASLSTEQLGQLAGEIRAVNETMGALGYFEAKKLDRFKLL